MRTLATTRLAGLPARILAAALSCAAATSAFAQDQQLIINEQVQLGDVFSTQTLNVEEAPEGLSADTVAVGNIAAGTGQGQAINFQSDQHLARHVESATDAQVNGQTGEYFVTTTSATGNSATGGTCCALTLGSSIQSISDSGVVAADAISRTGDRAGSISVDAAAVGNTTGWNAVNGEIQAWTQQSNDGLTTATNSGQFAGSPGNIGLSATSVSNNVTVDATQSYLDIGVEQSRRGDAIAVVNAAVDSGVDVQSVATVSGNLVDLAATSQEAALNVKQHTAADTTAYSDLVVGEWSGDANSVAYGVGNSVVMANQGPWSSLYAEQNSTGDVTATAAFTGGDGRGVFANSTAIGNAVSGYACNTCEGQLYGQNRQINGSNVRSQSNVMITGRAGMVSSSSTAIGNSATYEVYGNGAN